MLENGNGLPGAAAAAATAVPCPTGQPDPIAPGAEAPRAWQRAHPCSPAAAAVGAGMHRHAMPDGTDTIGGVPCPGTAATVPASPPRSLTSPRKRVHRMHQGSAGDAGSHLRVGAVPAGIGAVPPCWHLLPLQGTFCDCNDVPLTQGLVPTRKPAGGDAAFGPSATASPGFRPDTALPLQSLPPRVGLVREGSSSRRAPCLTQPSAAFNFLARFMIIYFFVCFLPFVHFNVWHRDS